MKCRAAASPYPAYPQSYDPVGRVSASATRHNHRYLLKST
ncbi:hypothetical protein CSC02_4390 [Enterobacter hormaechei subsp. hoffmannii]|nr:hypothetical protein CSC02_4390 [Enterobacter hormaechei subsp. hoffmannii]